MHKSIFCYLLSILFFTTTIFAQTADEVINKHLAATGGIEKWKGVKSLYMEGVAVMQNGQEVTSKIYKVQDQLYRRDVDFGMGKMTMLVTNKEGWMASPRNAGKFEAMPAEMLNTQQTELDVAGPLVDYAAKGHQATLEGKETIDGKEAWKLKMKLKSGQEFTYYIDVNTNYLIRTSFVNRNPQGRGQQQGGDGTVKIDYSDFRKTDDGLVFPYTITMGGMGAAMNMEKIEVNKPVDPKLFKPEN